MPWCKELIKGSGAEQMFVQGNFLFVSQSHSDKVEAFRINQTPSYPSGFLTEIGLEFTGGITPQGVVISPDGKTVYVANLQTEDVSFLRFDATSGSLTRQGVLPVGVTPSTLDPTTGGNGQGLFATDEEVGLRWFFTQSCADDHQTATSQNFNDAQKSCGFCHWQSRHDGAQWNVGANAIGGVKISALEWWQGSAGPDLSGPLHGRALILDAQAVLRGQVGSTSWQSGEARDDQKAEQKHERKDKERVVAQDSQVSLMFHVATSPFFMVLATQRRRSSRTFECN